MNRRILISGGAAVLFPLVGRAQSGTNRLQIGMLSLGRGDSSDASVAVLNAFLPALQQLGHHEVSLHRKFAAGDAQRLNELAVELALQGVDAIVALATPAVKAAKQATRTIPIIGIGMADPVEDELVASLARPGGNVTGTTFLGPELLAKRLQLLKELVPRLSRAAVLWQPRAYGDRTMSVMLREIESAARAMDIELRYVPANGPADLDEAFPSIELARPDGLVLFPSAMLYSQYPRIVEFAGKNKIPTMYAAREGVELGGLVSYGVNLIELSRTTAAFLDQILKGARAADLPIQQATKFELIINLKTAQMMGLSVRRELLLIADETID